MTAQRTSCGREALGGAAGWRGEFRAWVVLPEPRDLGRAADSDILSVLPPPSCLDRARSPKCNSPMNAAFHVQFERSRRRSASTTSFGWVNRRGAAERETGNGHLKPHSRKQKFPTRPPIPRHLCRGFASGRSADGPRISVAWTQQHRGDREVPALVASGALGAIRGRRKAELEYAARRDR